MGADHLIDVDIIIPFCIIFVIIPFFKELLFKEMLKCVCSKFIFCT